MVKKYFVLRCPKCGMHTFYSPSSSKVKRRRRTCPYCGTKFEVKEDTIVTGPHTADEVREIISKLNDQNLKKDTYRMTNGHPVFKKIKEVIEKEAEKKAISVENSDPEDIFFEKKSDGHQGYSPMTNDQKDDRAAKARIRPEVDWVQISGHFEKPDVFTYLGGDILEGYVTKNFGFGSITVYSSGAFTIRFDSSDPVNIELLSGFIAAIKKATGAEAYFNVDGYEATIQIDVDEELGQKITKTMDKEKEATIAWFDIMPYLKVYRKGRTDKYRLESSEFKRIIEGINDFIAEKMPHSVQRNNTMAVMIMNPVNDQKLDQIKGDIYGIQQEIGGITAVLDALVTYVTNHSERMTQEHELIIAQNREIIQKLDMLRTVSAELDVMIVNALSEPKTIQELADEIGVSYATCYYHISKLETRGVVTSEFVRSGQRGRPKKVYRRIENTR
ncbi:MAG: winged helix-turn-helix transcriptional regulator [Candidatus Odinarchaeota archaeon]|nr:winged helix-turn-helix transcriptional regulator [Candidatus Odinarchaeota archaeon]